ncbi:subtilisin-like serine protease [Caulobacter sp. AP07]|uniref:S8 family serine peptidase n=1 Tax=Caulobacter sp. AP07 TaxID=1144304 RepID=UPI0002721FBB|nr:S8 family serine peptidase [Caulobacter sp. AP07]EJL37923.1 subtilisin-like serine protease [Caulobacter sp. AP07]
MTFRWPRLGPAAAMLPGLLVLFLAAPAFAQLLPSPSSVLGGLPLPDPRRDPLARAVGQAAEELEQLTPRALVAARLDRLSDLVRRNPKALELDDLGQPVVRAEVLAISPSPQALETVRAAGFSVARRTRSDDLGLELVTLTPPKGMSAKAAVRRLRELDPTGDYDFNHLYADAGAGASPGPVAVAAASGGEAARVGLLDGGVDAAQPAFAGVKIQSRGFGPGGVRPGAHGTAVASVLVAGGVGQILAADVYGRGPTGGSAEAIVSALAWMAQARVAVVNVSLVGPPNGPLGVAVRALVARGCLIVAAVGNDGPAAPALYPASYPGVIAVTGVDRRRRLLPEAGRAAHVDFAAYGAEVKVAAPGGRTAIVRGTSYAAPVVAARLARMIDVADPQEAKRAVARLGEAAIDLGAPGPDPLYGRGLVEAAGK